MLAIVELAMTLFFLWAIYQVPEDAIKIRFLLFGENTRDIGNLTLNSTVFARKFLFKEYDKKKISPDFYSNFKDSIKSPAMLSGNEIESIKALVLTFSRNGGTGCGSYHNLIENFQLLKSGVGCCADHAAALMSLASEQGILVREVHNRVHTVSEFFDVALDKWVFVDPMFALMVRGEKGNYLSFAELGEIAPEGGFRFLWHTDAYIQSHQTGNPLVLS